MVVGSCPKVEGPLSPEVTEADLLARPSASFPPGSPSLPGHHPPPRFHSLPHACLRSIRWSKSPLLRQPLWRMTCRSRRSIGRSTRRQLPSLARPIPPSTHPPSSTRRTLSRPRSMITTSTPVHRSFCPRCRARVGTRLTRARATRHTTRSHQPQTRTGRRPNCTDPPTRRSNRGTSNNRTSQEDNPTRRTDRTDRPVGISRRRPRRVDRRAGSTGPGLLRASRPSHRRPPTVQPSRRRRAHPLAQATVPVCLVLMEGRMETGAA